MIELWRVGIYGQRFSTFFSLILCLTETWLRGIETALNLMATFGLDITEHQLVRMR